MSAKHNPCEDIQATIDQMSAREHQDVPETVRLHVETCTDCRAYFEKACRLGNLLDQWTPAEAKKNITAGVMADIAQLEHSKNESRNNPWPVIFNFITRRVSVSVAAILVMLIALAGSLGLNLVQQQRLSQTQQDLVVALQDSRNPASPIHIRLPDAVEKILPRDVVPASNTESIHSLFISPQNIPSSLVIILGAPPVVSLEPEPVVTPNSEAKPI